MTMGIYLLKFKGTNKVYVGQSLRIEERFTKHKLRIKTNISNYKLQDAYRLYGMPYLEIIDITKEEEDLDSLENANIELYDSVNNGFNINSKAGGGGVGLQGENHSRSLYTNNQIISVFKYLITEISSFKHIELLTKVSIHTIRDISKGKAHKWLKEYDEEAYSFMLSKINTRTKNTLQDKGIVAILIDSNGLEHTVTNITEFSKINKLNKSHISGVINKKRITHLGWKLK